MIHMGSFNLQMLIVYKIEHFAMNRYTTIRLIKVTVLIKQELTALYVWLSSDKSYISEMYFRMLAHLICKYD